MIAVTVATIVDTGALLRSAAVALGAGVGITLAFSLAIYGGARFVDMRNDNRPLAATAAGALVFVALAVSAAAVAAAITIMLE